MTRLTYKRGVWCERRSIERVAAESSSIGFGGKRLLLPPGGARDISDLCVVAHTRRCCFLSRTPARRGRGLTRFRLGFFGSAQYVLPLPVATAIRKRSAECPCGCVS